LIGGFLLNFKSVARLLTQRSVVKLTIAVIVLGVIAYGRGFTSPFQLDDIPVIFKNPLIRHLDSLDKLFWYDPSRFLTHLTFALNYHFSGFNTFGFHLVNFLLHAICAILVFYLIRETLCLASKDHQASSKDQGLIAFFSALIFLLHPIQTESVTYIVQRSTILATIAYTLALILYLRLKKGFKIKDYQCLWGVVLLGAMTKPIFVTVPLVVLLYEALFFRLSWKTIKKEAVLLLPFLATVVLVPVFLILFSLNYFSESFDLSKLTYATRVTSEVSRWDYLLTQWVVLVKYIQLLFLPINQNLDYDYSLVRNLFSLPAVLSLIALTSIIIAAYLLRKKNPVISFCVAWFFIVLIPESTIFPLPDLIFEHRLYVAVIGFSFLVSWGLRAIFTKKEQYVILLSGIVLSLLLLTFARNIFWAHPIILLEDVVKKSPTKARPHNNLGLFYQEKGFLDLAQAQYERAIALDSRYTVARINLGQIYFKKGKVSEAQRQWEEVLRIDPQSFEANVNLGNLYYQQGQLEFASAQYYKAASIRPQSDVPYLNLGNIYMRLNNFGDAENYFKTAIRHNPHSAESYYALGNLYLAQKMYSQSISANIQALVINPQYADAYNVLGIAYDGVGNFEGAERCFKKAIEIDANHTAAYLNLAHYYKKTGQENLRQEFEYKAKEIQKRFLRAKNNLSIFRDERKKPVIE